MPSYNFPVQIQPSEPVEIKEKSPPSDQAPIQNKEISSEEKNNSLP
jgi:hypothetical protein